MFGGLVGLASSLVLNLSGRLFSILVLFVVFSSVRSRKGAEQSTLLASIGEQRRRGRTAQRRTECAS